MDKLVAARRRADPTHGPGGASALTPARGEGGGPRYPEFDALRGTAILLVVTLHAALAYTRLDIPGLLWGVRERSGHGGFDLFSWWAMGVSVPLFFAISGFFAALVESGRGPRAFLEGRARRIVVPTLIAAPTILPLCFLAWCLGWLATGRCDFNEVRRMVFLDPRIMGELYGPAHLWFLEYLIPMLLAFGLLRAARPARSGDTGGAEPRAPLALAWWGPLALTIPTALLLALGRALGMADLPLDRHNSFIPDAVRLAHYATFFGFGVALYRARGSLDALRRRGAWYLLASLPVFALRARLLPLDWSGRGGGGVVPGLIATGALGSWLALFGLIGLARRHLGRPSRAARYLAGASFWVHLVHLPIVGLIQADLVPIPWPTTAKFAFTLALTLALGLGTYEVLVRKTALGRLLEGGTRKARPGPAASRPGRDRNRRKGEVVARASA